MSQAELEEHGRYLTDERKLAAYRAALAEVVRPGDRVLDLGAGTGVLGLLACEAGAGHVLAVDRGDIISLARRIAVDNGFGDRVEHVQALSTELDVDEPVDVVVCDQIGGLVHDAGILRCYADARRRLLREGGVLVPAAFRLFAVPVEFPRARAAQDLWSSTPGGLDVSAARTLADNTEWRYVVEPGEVTRLGDAFPLTSFASDHDDQISGAGAVTVSRDGRLDGFLGYFEAQMSPSVTLTNDPWHPERFQRWVNFYGCGEPVAVRTGDEVGFSLDLRPRLSLATWSTAQTSPSGATSHDRRSTFQGTLVSASTLAALDLTAPVPTPTRSDLVTALVEMMSRQCTTAELVSAALTATNGFADRAGAEAFVHRLVSLCR